MDETERKAKRAAYMRDWHRRNPDKARAAYAKKAEDPEYRERARQRAKVWYWANRERALEAARRRNDAREKVGPAEGERNPNWKGERVGYDALHRWVIRNKGNPTECEHCGDTEAKRYEWANVDHEYRRALDDYMRLCTTCHRAWDREHGLSIKGGQRRRIHAARTTETNEQAAV